MQRIELQQAEYLHTAYVLLRSVWEDVIDIRLSVEALRRVQMHR
jgi:hypothetical protein